MLVSTTSAPEARTTTSSVPVRSYTSHAPNASNRAQLKSPGFNVYPSNTTIFISQSFLPTRTRPPVTCPRSAVVGLPLGGDDDLRVPHNFASAFKSRSVTYLFSKRHTPWIPWSFTSFTCSTSPAVLRIAAGHRPSQSSAAPSRLAA